MLFPFLDESRMDARVLSALADVLARHRAFDLRFAHCGRFPGVLYLVPWPQTQVRQLTEAIAGRWPETPPYGGRFTEIVPHLTVADGHDDEVLDQIEADLVTKLPFTFRAASVDLLVHDGATWQERMSFPLIA
ncbi:hypothetical protein SRB17_25910 [Streptomyces sp. RB17]|nr:hypothetical protein [Streptomyces sp. RB17]